MADTEISKVQVVIRKFLYETRSLVNDPQKAVEWLRSFRETLQFQELADSPNGYALELIEEARGFSDCQRRKAQMKQARRTLSMSGNTNPTREDLERTLDEIYGEDTTTNVAAKPSMAPAVVPVADPWGSFRNVMITYEQHAEIARRIGNLDRANELIDSFSAALADGSVKSSNHYATLLKWVQYRKDKESSEDRRTPYQKNQDELLALYKATSAKLKENGN